VPRFIRFNAEETTLLEELGGALLPLKEWIQSKSYVPPEPTPWRQDGVSLSLKELGAIPFLERLLAETSGDADLIAHFEKVEQDPLRACPIEEVRDWRSRRGLEREARFDIVESENLLTAGKDSAGKNQPIARVTFYAKHLPLLVQAARAAKAAGLNPRIFAEDLLQDRSEFWPSGSPKSSIFIKRFVEDLLYAVMGMRNQVPEPLRSALLTELGELRRVGNAFEPKHAMAAVEQFKEALDKASQRPASEAETEESAQMPMSPPPVGSPPLHTKL